MVQEYKKLLRILFCFASIIAVVSLKVTPPPSLPRQPYLLQIAYDGGRYQGWVPPSSAAVGSGDVGSEEESSSASTSINPISEREPSAIRRTKKQGKGPKPLPFLHDKLGKALSIIHSHEPIEALSLKPAIPTDVGIHAHAQLISYQPPCIPFAGDFSRASHSLNGILSDDLRVISVMPVPWPDFDIQRDLLLSRFSYTIVLGPVGDPTLRHYTWMYTPAAAGAAFVSDSGPRRKTTFASLLEKWWVCAAAAENQQQQRRAQGGDDRREEELLLLREMEKEAFDVAQAHKNGCTPTVSNMVVQKVEIKSMEGPGEGPARAPMLKMYIDILGGDGGGVASNQKAIMQYLGDLFVGNIDDEVKMDLALLLPPTCGLVLESLHFKQKQKNTNQFLDIR